MDFTHILPIDEERTVKIKSVNQTDIRVMTLILTHESKGVTKENSH